MFKLTTEFIGKIKFPYEISYFRIIQNNENVLTITNETYRDRVYYLKELIINTNPYSRKKQKRILNIFFIDSSYQYQNCIKHNVIITNCLEIKISFKQNINF